MVVGWVKANVAFYKLYCLSTNISRGLVALLLNNYSQFLIKVTPIRCPPIRCLIFCACSVENLMEGKKIEKKILKNPHCAQVIMCNVHVLHWSFTLYLKLVRIDAVYPILFAAIFLKPHPLSPTHITTRLVCTSL